MKETSLPARENSTATRVANLPAREIERALRDWYTYLGKKGGASRSDKKRNAVRSNVEKARAVLAEKRKQGAA